MRTFELRGRQLLLLLGGALALSSAAQAIPTLNADGTVAAPVTLGLTSANDCTNGTASVDINANNVRATLYNIGGLFWRGANAQYEIPAGSGLTSIYAFGIWIGGQLNGNAAALRFAGSTYGPYEYYPGPLQTDGTTNATRCTAFDQFWKVTREDIAAYNANGITSATNPALINWPIAQGAPYYQDLNGNGRRDPETEPRIELNTGDQGYSTELGQGATLDLAGGFRPDIIGDQGIWWVMNDAGGTHGWGNTPPVRVEVRAHAFGFRTADAINNTTFYRYQFVYRGQQPLLNTYIGLWADPDLGNYTDDYIGSNLELGLGYVYNGDADDDASEGGYGTLPPALGFDFFQGPRLPDGTRLQVETFFYFTNQAGVTGDPAAGEDRAAAAYGFMQGLWKDGTPMTVGGDGYNPGSTDITRFAFPGIPPAFWSEYNADGQGRANLPADRRLGVASGPFPMQPGDIQEVVFGIIWSQAPEACRSTATPQLTSLQQLKVDDITVQGAFNAEFALPTPPPALAVNATPLDQQIILEFDSVTGNNEDIYNYEVVSPFAPVGAPDDTYNFEGVRIFQYSGPSDQTGVLVKTFDINNSITTIVDQQLDCTTGAVVTGVVAQGENSGSSDSVPSVISITQDAFTGDQIRNNTTYYFGVQSYAYNEFSSPSKVFASPITRVETRPARVAARNDGTVLNSEFGDAIAGTAGDNNVGQGVVAARVINPAAVTGDTYQVVFFSQLNAQNALVGTNYRVVNTTTGQTVYDGAEVYRESGQLAPQRVDAIRVDGLSISITGPPAEAASFQVVRNNAGPVDPIQPGSLGGAPGFYPTPNGGNPPAATAATPPQLRQQALSTRRWLIGPNQTFGGSDYEDFLANVFNATEAVPYDWEIRFTAAGSQAPFIFPGGLYGPAGATPGRLVTIPFELWRIGIATPDDPSDDVQYIPGLIDVDGGNASPGTGIFNMNTDASIAAGIYGVSFGLTTSDSELSGAANDPTSDAFAWYRPANDSPGSAGYQEVIANFQANPVAARTALIASPLAFDVMSFIGWNLANTNTGAYINFLPEEGTVFRILTTKPNSAGDTFTINSSAQAVARGNADAARAALDLIAITPNPYRGFSEYEAQGNQNIARIVNLPAQATVRIFTLNGTLLRTIEKTNPNTTTIDWNLTSEAGLQVASGMYLIHVDARDSAGTSIGERVLKFGVVRRRVQLEVL